MTYDFTTIMDRRGEDAIAVDGLLDEPSGFAPTKPAEGFDAIPMWVADMNFPVVPTVTEALVERACKPHFGYFSPRDEYFSSIIRWHETRHGVRGLTPECIGYENGVLGGVVSTLEAFARPGDAVLLLYQEHRERGLFHRALAARERRGRRVADGLRRYGAEARRP